MRIYIGLDDTDGKTSSMGTGRLARNLAGELLHFLDGNAILWGVLRHQLPKLDEIAYTSNNSSACIVLDSDSAMPPLAELLNVAARYIVSMADMEGDPGLCMLTGDEISDQLVSYALRATSQPLRQADAMGVVPDSRLLGLGGTNDGIIGAAAAVGLTKHGWCGRFIEFGDMRKAPVPQFVGEVQELGIRVVSVDRDPAVPLAEDALDGGWIRPSLWAHGPVLQVVRTETGCWKTAHTKRPKHSGQSLAERLDKKAHSTHSDHPGHPGHSGQHRH